MVRTHVYIIFILTTIMLSCSSSKHNDAYQAHSCYLQESLNDIYVVLEFSNNEYKISLSYHSEGAPDIIYSFDLSAGIIIQESERTILKDALSGMKTILVPINDTSFVVESSMECLKGKHFIYAHDSPSLHPELSVHRLKNHVKSGTRKTRKNSNAKELFSCHNGIYQNCLAADVSESLEIEDSIYLYKIMNQLISKGTYVRDGNVLFLQEENTHGNGYLYITPNGELETGIIPGCGSYHQEIFMNK